MTTADAIEAAVESTSRHPAFPALARVLDDAAARLALHALHTGGFEVIRGEPKTWQQDH